MIAQAQPYYLAAARAFAAVQYMFPDGRDVECPVELVRGVTARSDLSDPLNARWWAMIARDPLVLHARMIAASSRLETVRLRLRECGILVRDAQEHAFHGPVYETYKSLLTELLEQPWTDRRRVTDDGEEWDDGGVTLHRVPVLAPQAYLLERMADVARHYTLPGGTDKQARDAENEAYRALEELAVQFPPGVPLGTGARVLVLGKEKVLSSVQQVDLLAALIQAGPAGLPFPEAKSVHKHPGEVLKKLAQSDPDWRAAIELPAENGNRGGYRIRYRGAAETLKSARIGTD